MQITLKGNAINLSGSFPSLGSQASGFWLPTAPLNDVVLGEFEGQKR